MNNKRVLVLSARQYDFDDETGKKIKGTKLNVIDFEDTQEDQGDVSGFIPSSLTLPFESFPHFVSKLPAYYDVSFSISFTSKKPVLKPVKFDYVQECNLSLVY